MTSKKQKERKIKNKKIKAKSRILNRRKKIEELKKEEKRNYMINEKFREKIDPIVKDLDKKKKIEEIKSLKSKEKLEKNMEILKALEEQYMQEKQKKDDLNKNLEEMGHSTLQDKLNALESKSRKQMTQEEQETGAIDLTEKSWFFSKVYWHCLRYYL